MNQNSTQLNGTSISRVEAAIESFRIGSGVLVLDDENRENEGDLVFPADSITHEQMALLIRECSGIVCLCITEKLAQKLSLPPMVEDNNSRFSTAFTVSIEAARGVTTGVSAKDRVTTIRTAIRPEAIPEDLNRPGHVFPLVARSGGVLERRGHTEATVELSRLAGLIPAGVLCELTNPDGTMARFDEVVQFAEKNHLPVVTIDDLVHYIHSDSNGPGPGSYALQGARDSSDPGA